MEHRIHAHRVEQLLCAIFRLAFRLTGKFLHGTGDDARDRMATVERRVGVLEHDLHRAHFVRRAVGDARAELATFKCDDASRVRFKNAEQCLGKCGLTRTRFTHESKRLASGQRHGHVGEYANFLIVLSESLRKVRDRQQVLALRGIEVLWQWCGAHDARQIDGLFVEMTAREVSVM